MYARRDELAVRLGVGVAAATDAVQVELQAQVDRALSAGIDVSHIDTHMGSVAHLRFIPSYLQLALQYRIPAMAPRLDEAGWRDQGLDQGTASFAAQFVKQLEAQGLPLVNHIEALPLDQPEERLKQAKQAFDALKSGLTHFIIHPAKDTPELRATTEDWRHRRPHAYKVGCRVVENFSTIILSRTTSGVTSHNHKEPKTRRRKPARRPRPCSRRGDIKQSDPSRARRNGSNNPVLYVQYLPRSSIVIYVLATRRVATPICCGEYHIVDRRRPAAD